MAKNKTKKSKDDNAPSTSKIVSKDTKTEDAPKSEIWQDSRFQHLLKNFDPRFKNLPKTQRKVKIDKRFQSMFTENKFNIKYTVDKYGRRINQSSADNLGKYYELNSDEESEAEENKNDEKGQFEAKASGSDEDDIAAEQRKEEQAISREIDENNDALVSDGEDVPKKLRERLFDPQIDYARGEGRLITDSSSDDDSSEDEDAETYLEHTWGELDAEAERTDKSTRRLAVCNMDWDRIRAVDMMVLFSSFLPPGGSILSVKIYMSEFGKERMKVEEKHGPVELVGLGKQVTENSDDSGDDNSEDEIVKAQDSDAEEGDEYHMEKLRQYQLNRLRYYYAVVECDSVASADKIYTECDGIEYESSATRLDLRFIPDDTSFDEDEPTDVCKELPDTSSYQPRLFTNTALQQAKVDLTWDETAVERRELSERLLNGKLEEVNDKDLRKIVAYSSEEEDSGNDENETEAKMEDACTEQSTITGPVTEKSKKSKKDDYISKYKALLAEINEKEQEEKNKKFEMEISWDVNEENEANEEEKDLELEAKPNSELTPIEKVLKKRSEKNKQRKLERKKKKLLAKGIDPDVADNYSDSDSLPDGIDMSDPYFAEEFASGNFIDPKAKKRDKKKKHLENQALDEEDAEKQAKELELLLNDDDESQQGKQHFSLEKIQKSEQETKSKRKRRKQLKKSKADIDAHTKEIEDNFKLNIEDDRFKALYTSPLFNIDPTDPNFKKTKGMEQFIHEKLKRRHGSEWYDGGNHVKANELASMETEIKKPRKKLEQTLLVKSLKRKLQGK